MFDYFKSQEYFIDQLWFIHDGIHYKGKGVLQWNPEGGFHVAANIEQGKTKLPYQKEIRSITFRASTTIYLRLSGGSQAILPVNFPNEIKLLQGFLSENTKRAIFIEPTSLPLKRHWLGSALFELKDGILFPDSVSVETKIGNSPPRQNFSRDGIHFEENSGLRVIGYQRDNKYLELLWNLPIEIWTKTNCWEFAQALQNSISMLAGQTLELKYREVYRANRTIREVIKNREPISLGKIFRPFDMDILDRTKIIELASFFISGQSESDTAKKIFFQMADASQQRTIHGQELLLSTILEAALRTLYKFPFYTKAKKRSDSYKLDQLIVKFCDEYLTSSEDTKKSWKIITSNVVNSHRLLRHRNAHPDWLSAEGGAYSKDELEETTNHMILLSRFYGYMIMGLANIKAKVPIFPLPVAEWKPIMSLSTGEPQKEK